MGLQPGSCKTPLLEDFLAFLNGDLVLRLRHDSMLDMGLSTGSGENLATGGPVFLQRGIIHANGLAMVTDPESLVELETGFFSHTLIFL